MDSAKRNRTGKDDSATKVSDGNGGYAALIEGFIPSVLGE